MTMPKGWENKVQSGPSATQSESTIWSDQITSGIFHKKVVETRYISNLAVSTSRGRISLSQVDDIVVMNSKRSSQSQYTGFSTGRYARYGMGNSKSNSRTVGDVVFMSGGKPVIVIEQVQDPHGVARLAKAARKQLIAQNKAAEKAALLEQKTSTSTVIQEEAAPQRKPMCLDPLNVETPMHKPPDSNWRLTHSMVDPSLIKSYEYPIQIIYWIDGKKNEFYNKMIIQPIEKGNYIEFVNDKDNSSTFKIEISKLTDVSNMGYQDMDIKIRLEYSYLLNNMSNIISPRGHTQSITVNVTAGKKDRLVELLNSLRYIENRTLYWIRVDDPECYLFLPFYGPNETIGYYNILASDNDGAKEIKKYS